MANVPFCFASFNTTSNPFALMVLMALVDTFNVIHRSSEAK